VFDRTNWHFIFVNVLAFSRSYLLACFHGDTLHRTGLWHLRKISGPHISRFGKTCRKFAKDRKFSACARPRL